MKSADIVGEVAISTLDMTQSSLVEFYNLKEIIRIVLPFQQLDF